MALLAGDVALPSGPAAVGFSLLGEGLQHHRRRLPCFWAAGRPDRVGAAPTISSAPRCSPCSPAVHKGLIRPRMFNESLPQTACPGISVSSSGWGAIVYLTLLAPAPFLCPPLSPCLFCPRGFRCGDKHPCSTSSKSSFYFPVSAFHLFLNTASGLFLSLSPPPGSVSSACSAFCRAASQPLQTTAQDDHP